MTALICVLVTLVIVGWLVDAVCACGNPLGALFSMVGGIGLFGIVCMYLGRWLL